MQQLTIDDAVSAGNAGSAIVFANAARRDPLFAAKAQEAMVRHLRACPGRQACSEDLVDVARAHGAVPHDDRAFGQVFRAMARQGLIITVGFTVRRKGRGAAGARIWALVQ